MSEDALIDGYVLCYVQETLDPELIIASSSGRSDRWSTVVWLTLSQGSVNRAGRWWQCIF